MKKPLYATIDGKKMVIEIQQYQMSQYPAITAYYKGEAWGVLSVNLPGVIMDTYHTFIDSNNFPNAARELAEAGIIKPEPRFSEQSGFCRYYAHELTGEAANTYEQYLIQQDA